MHKCQPDRASAKEAISGEESVAMHLESEHEARLTAAITSVSSDKKMLLMGAEA